MKCKHCGEEIANDSNFCEHCGKKLVSVKHLDIRWCLMPAMILASFMLSSFIDWHAHRNLKDELIHQSIPIVIVLTITAIGGIKKAVRPSFLILACFFLLTNVIKIYFVLEPEGSYLDHSCCVYWHPNDSDHNMSYVSVSTTGKPESELADERLLKGVTNTVAEGFRAMGCSNPEIGAIWTQSGICLDYNWNFLSKIILEPIMSVIYLVYAFVAYKKNWKF